MTTLWFIEIETFSINISSVGDSQDEHVFLVECIDQSVIPMKPDALHVSVSVKLPDIQPLIKDVSTQNPGNTPGFFLQASGNFPEIFLEN